MERLWLGNNGTQPSLSSKNIWKLVLFYVLIYEKKKEKKHPKYFLNHERLRTSKTWVFWANLRSLRNQFLYDQFITLSLISLLVVLAFQPQLVLSFDYFLWIGWLEDDKLKCFSRYTSKCNLIMSESVISFQDFNRPIWYLKQKAHWEHPCLLKWLISRWSASKIRSAVVPRKWQI